MKIFLIKLVVVLSNYFFKNLNSFFSDQGNRENREKASMLQALKVPSILLAMYRYETI